LYYFRSISYDYPRTSADVAEVLVGVSF
jgi:hypothetical protein